MINNLNNRHNLAFRGVNTNEAGEVLKYLKDNSAWRKGIDEIANLSDQLGQDVILKGSDYVTRHGDFMLVASNGAPVMTPWGANTWNATIMISSHNLNETKINSFFTTIKTCLENYKTKLSQ